MIYTKNIQKHNAIDKFIDTMPCGKMREVGVELFEWNGNRYMISMDQDYDVPKCRHKLDKLLRLLGRLKKINKLKNSSEVLIL